MQKTRRRQKPVQFRVHYKIRLICLVETNATVPLCVAKYYLALQCGCRMSFFDLHGVINDNISLFSLKG